MGNQVGKASERSQTYNEAVKQTRRGNAVLQHLAVRGDEALDKAPSERDDTEWRDITRADNTGMMADSINMDKKAINRGTGSGGNAMKKGGAVRGGGIAQRGHGKGTIY